MVSALRLDAIALIYKPINSDQSSDAQRFHTGNSQVADAEVNSVNKVGFVDILDAGGFDESTSAGYESDCPRRRGGRGAGWRQILRSSLKEAGSEEVEIACQCGHRTCPLTV